MHIFTRLLASKKGSASASYGIIAALITLVAGCVMVTLSAQVSFLTGH